MAIILFALAIFLLWSAGAGAYFLLTKSARQYCRFEFVALSFLLGTICIALSSFLASLFLPRLGQQIFVALLCLLLGVYGGNQLRQKKCLPIAGRGRGKILPSLILLAQIFTVSAIGIRTPLGWDGLFNWEMKAKVFYEQGGITKQFLQSDALRWAHVDYPPLLPLNQAWTYHWIGQAHQSAGKTFSIVFYAIAVLLMLSASRHWSKSHTFNYAILLFSIPLLWVGDGSATTGHADFPLAVFFLAAAKLLLDYAHTGERARLQLLGAISFGMAIVKQDSIVLLIAVWLVLLVVLFAPQTKKSVLQNFRGSLILAPAFLLYAAWKIAMHVLSPYAGEDFAVALPTSGQAFMSRVQTVSNFFWRELSNPLHWGFLWFVFALFLLVQIVSWIQTRRSNSTNEQENFAVQNSQAIWALLLLVSLPLGADFALYLLLSTASAKLTLEYWLTSSAARLILQIAPVALLSVQALASDLPRKTMPADVQ